MKKYQKILLAILSGLLLSAAWPTWGTSPLIFIGLVPLLILEDRAAKGEKSKVFWLSSIAFLVWNLITTWWIWNATPGAIAAWLLATLFMAVPFWLFHFTKKKLCNNRWGTFLLIPYWMSYELLTYHWAAKWPWLNLGNVFSSNVSWVQWYEYTGVAGGTLWVLLVNILIFIIIDTVINKEKKTNLILGIITIALVLAPIIYSVVVYDNYEEKGEDVEVVVVQQNCDPWNEQFDADFYNRTIKRNTLLAAPLMTPKTQFVVSSESAIQEGIWLDQLDRSESLKHFHGFMKEHPQAAFVIGGTTYEWVPKGMENDFPARYFASIDQYYYCHNSALLIDTVDVQHRNKTQLAPGVEAIPEWMGFLKNWSVTMGIARGTLKTDPAPHNMSFGGHTIAAAICYESAFGGYVREFTKKGADLIFVLTNDGWWGDTPGYKQHFEFSKLRAIENRRCVARSANTGRSGFFNQRGDVLQQTAYWQPDAIRETLKANTEVTFYAKHGDYLSHIALYITILQALALGAKLVVDATKKKKA